MLPEASAPLEDLACPRALVSRAARSLKPPKRLKLSEWADEHFYLSAESAAEPGRWRTIPYQRGIMDAITDPKVERVSVMKSARVGYTKILDAAIGYYMHHDPCGIMVVQPTVEDAEGFSKEEIDPMLRDCPALRAVMPKAASRDGKNTILLKKFTGGVLSMVGANSGRGFRRVSRKVVCLDEVDGYPPSAGDEGDPIRLAEKRSEYYWDRKIIVGSTPLVAEASRIHREFGRGDQRRYYVPCPECGHMAPLVFRGEDGHSMKWPEGKPKEAFFACQQNGCVIEHKSKRWMVERGEWRAAAPFEGHASFHIWAAYSYSPNATWGHIASEFLEAQKAGHEELKTFVNTGLGEVWVEKGDAPDWKRLEQRCEDYTAPPREVVVITAGVDVQKDRLVYEVVGWGEDLQSWSLEADVIMGDTAKEETWAELDALLLKTWRREDGTEFPIHVMAVDAGFNTQTVYNWARRYSLSRVIAVKGGAASRTLLGQPTAVDMKANGKRMARGAKVWIVGANLAKSELYGFLRLDPPTKEARDAGAPFPPGFCHFNRGNGEDYFKQLTGEHLVKIVKRTGHIEFEWQIRPGHENHFLDCRVYARAATARVGLDRRAAAKRAKAKAPAPAPPRPVPTVEAPPASTPEPARAIPRPARGGWLGGAGRGSWLRR